ncbi:MAG: hypothetical protein WDM77_21150 [Steroidobacteraceae bacterium]
MRAARRRPSAQSSGASGAHTTTLATQKLTDRITLITGAPGNLLALSTVDGVLLVDSGSAATAHAVRASLAGAKVQTLFNTHYPRRPDRRNALFGAAGAAIHSLRQHPRMAGDGLLRTAEDRW